MNKEIEKSIYYKESNHTGVGPIKTTPMPKVKEPKYSFPELNSIAEQNTSILIPVDEKVIPAVLNHLSNKAHREAEKKGKWKQVGINHALLWLSSEVIEAYKAKQRGEGKVEEELADVIIMTLSIAKEMGIDIGEAVIKKMKANADKT